MENTTLKIAQMEQRVHKLTQKDPVGNKAIINKLNRRIRQAREGVKHV